MSKTKFAAAKELIQEKRYEEARAILKTINDPKADEWLTKLDRIDPYAFPEKPKNGSTAMTYGGQVNQEQKLYYERENRRAGCRSLALGTRAILMSLGLFFACAVCSYSSPQPGAPTSFTGYGIPFGIMGAILLIVGIWCILQGKRL